MASLRLSVKRLASFGLVGRDVQRSLLRSNIRKFAPLQAATIAHKDHLDPEVMKKIPKPWPYKEKKYGLIHQTFLLDRTTRRFHENTKVIVVDGNMGAGKTKVAQELADQLGMKYYAPPDFEQLYIDEGFDFRHLNDLMPEMAHYPDLKMFHENPHHPTMSFFQVSYYQQRYAIYVEALAHLFSTGQGVVVERDPWSDAVFMEALYKHGYILKDTHDFYSRLRKNTLHEILRPHVVIYLDVTPDESWKRLKAKNSLEANSKVINEEFITSVGQAYRNVYLPAISQHAELLVYDANREIDVDFIVEELEKVDFSEYEYVGEKTEDWRFIDELEHSLARRRYCNQQNDLCSNFYLPTYDVEGMHLSIDAADVRADVHTIYAKKYMKGYDPKKEGVLNVMLRGRSNYWDEQKRWWSPIQMDF